MSIGTRESQSERLIFYMNEAKMLARINVMITIMKIAKKMMMVMWGLLKVGTNVA